METEIEAKFPDIDADAVRARLRSIGAVRKHPEVLMKRRNFDFPDRKRIAGWIRVRDEGDKVTLSYKQVDDRSLHGTKETVVDVSDFDKACAILLAVGMISKSYQETKREKWSYKGSEITIDTWPWVPTFVEIESPSESEIRGIAEELGFSWKDAIHGSVEPIYQMHYDFTEDEIDHWEEIVFSDPPAWLAAKKKGR